MRKLGFIIAGAQKCGTTALWQYLRQHAAIFLPAQKELHFFDDDNLDWSSPPYRSMLHERLAHARRDQVCGEATPIYMYWPSALERIVDYNPQMKLIIILRDPVARAFSHWRMQISRGLETLSFSDAIRGGRTRIKCSDPLSCRRFSYVERGFFGKQIQHALSLFPPDRILFLTKAELRADQDATLNRVCDFLMVPRFAIRSAGDLLFSFAGNAVAEPSRQDVEYLRCIFNDDFALAQTLAGMEVELEPVTT